MSFPSRGTARSRVAGRAGRLLLAVAATGGLAACGTAPLSYVYDRQVYYQAVLHRYPVFVTQVDGISPGIRPIPITMGDHVVAIDAEPVAGFSQPVRKVYPLTIAPCTRYYLAAQRTSPLKQDWDLVVERTFASGGCDPAVELEKARADAAAGKQPPITSSIEALTPNPEIPQPGVLVGPALPSLR